MNNELKPGYMTTEFWVTVMVQLVGLVAALGYVTSDQSSVLTQAVTQIGGIVSMVAAAFGYSLSRGMAKK
jgi:fumarate reductase subunit D